MKLKDNHLTLVYQGERSRSPSSSPVKTPEEVVAELSDSPNASASSPGPKYSETESNANNGGAGGEPVVTNGNGKHDLDEETFPSIKNEGGKENSPSNSTEHERVNGSCPGPESAPQRNGRQSPREEKNFKEEKPKMASSPNSSGNQSELKESGAFPTNNRLNAHFVLRLVWFSVKL